MIWSNPKTLNVPEWFWVILIILSHPETNQPDFEICNRDQKLHEITEWAFILERYNFSMRIDASSDFDHASENIDCKLSDIWIKTSHKIVNSLKINDFFEFIQILEFLSRTQNAITAVYMSNHSYQEQLYLFPLTPNGAVILVPKLTKWCSSICSVAHGRRYKSYHI